jgi:biopolymer transport protein ExbD
MNGEKVMRLPNDADRPFQINIVPMIDVIFAILAFFILSTLFLSRSEGLPVEIPAANTGEPTAATSPLVVTIDRSGSLALNQEAIQLEALVAQVRALALTEQQPVVVLNADAAVSHGQVVSVMDRLRSIPGVRMAIATQRPQPDK